MAGGGEEEEVEVGGLTGEVGGFGESRCGFGVAGEGGFGFADDEKNFGAEAWLAGLAGEGVEGGEAGGLVSGGNEFPSRTERAGERIAGLRDGALAFGLRFLSGGHGREL